MADERRAEPAGDDLVFRRGKLRKRDDPAYDLFQQALADLANVAEVRRTLLELSRFYDPVTNGPVVDLETRRRVVEALEAGRDEDARRLLDERFRAYRGEKKG